MTEGERARAYLDSTNVGQTSGLLVGRPLDAFFKREARRRW